MSAHVVFVETCWACPEQYDAFIGGQKVGYLRLRHGAFTVSAPDCGGEVIHTAAPKGDGRFDDHERDRHLSGAASALWEWSRKRKAPAALSYSLVQMEDGK